MFRRYLTPRRVLFILFLFGLLFVFYYSIRTSIFPNQIAREIRNCQIDSELQKNLLNLASSTTKILSTQNITHFLCYGTLWGALRHGDLLPWKREFDFCMIDDDEFLKRKDEGYLRRLFRRRGLEMEYSHTGGFYTTWDMKDERTKDGLLNIYVFERELNEKKLRRVGLNRLMPAGTDGADSFPMHLIAYPLNKIQLKDLILPVPREGVEIQKYHYKDNWWMETKPKECDGK